MTWAAILTASVGCLALKLAGWSVPARFLQGARLQRSTVALPAAMLAALVLVQTVTVGHRLMLDARSAGLLVAAAALLLRAPFLVVVLAAAGTAALLRLF